MSVGRTSMILGELENLSAVEFGSERISTLSVPAASCQISIDKEINAVKTVSGLNESCFQHRTSAVTETIMKMTGRRMFKPFPGKPPTPTGILKTNANSK